MSKIKLYQVDAFANELFTGNPAAVCILKQWESNHLMQSIAAENNLAETAFVVPSHNRYEIRWFTPTVEVDLCGHATLASAYVLLNCYGLNTPELIFDSKSGPLKVTRQNDVYFLDFPSDVLTGSDLHNQIKACTGFMPVEVYKGKSDYIAVLSNESDVRSVEPFISEILKLDSRGLIITAKGQEVDFVSRFFGPQVGINEDPVTGSAHTSLIPLWSQKLGIIDMTARQLSTRGGELICKYLGDRCLIGGKAKLYLTGELEIAASTRP